MEAWERLGKPRLILAPMVDASELAWRLLSRRHGAQLCFTPMLHSSVFVRDARYRAEALASCQEDRPLIAQFCGHDPDLLVKAAVLAAPFVDGIDINLGCPQAIAKRGRYGAFLQDEWPLLTEIVKRLKEAVTVPVSCKIRIYTDVEKTIEYAKMLEKAGASFLTVHGRTREQKGRLTGIASWQHIKAVKQSVRIPVIANGNIQYAQDVDRCIEETGCDGVMSAEGNLYNPAIFIGVNPPAWEMALEYLDLVDKYPCPTSYVRGHLFKLFHHVLSLPENSEIRAALAGRATVTDFRNIVVSLYKKYHRFHEGLISWKSGESKSYDLVLPPWLCQPYVRPPPEEVSNGGSDIIEGIKRRNSEGEAEMSKKQLKKLKKISERKGCGRKYVALCAKTNCPNPVGLKCDSRLCKVCCRNKCYEEDKDCLGHGILIRTRRAKARMFAKAASATATGTDIAVQV